MREGPLFIDPLRFAMEAGAGRHGRWLGRGVFVRTFRPDGFAGFDADAQIGAGNVDSLAAQRAKMHFDAALFRVPAGFVSEFLEVEIGAEFAIDASEDVHVERGGDAGGVVVREQLCGDIFFEIGADEKRIARREDRADMPEKIVGGGSIEITDGAAEKKNANGIARFAAIDDRLQAFEIRLFETDDVDEVDLAKFLFASGERGGRDFDWVIESGLAARDGFENPASFFAAAAAEFGDVRGKRRARDHFAGVAAEQARVRAGKAVLRQKADGFEERGANLVVKIFGKNFTLAGFGEACSHVIRELRRQRRHYRLQKRLSRHLCSRG